MFRVYGLDLLVFTKLSAGSIGFFDRTLWNASKFHGILKDTSRLYRA